MHGQPTTAYLGLGSNLCEPRRQLKLALDAIAVLPGLDLQRVSRLVCSSPQGTVLDQPDFINAVCEITTTLQAKALLNQLLVLEKRLGRVRLIQDGPRIIDLDLLLFGQQTIDENVLILPHPRLHLRRFVLEPLLDIAPDIVIPGLGLARDLLSACENQQLSWLQPEYIGKVI